MRCDSIRTILAIVMLAIFVGLAYIGLAESVTTAVPDQEPILFGATGGNLQNGGVWNYTDALFGMLAPGGKVGLYAMGINGGKIVHLADGYISQVNVLDDVIYYVSLTNPKKTTGYIYCVPADGSQEPKQLGKDKAIFLLAEGNTLYYTLEKTGHLYRMNMDGENRTLLIKGKCGLLGGDGKFVYFENKSKKTFNTLDVDSGVITSVRLDFSGYGQLVNSMFYYRDTKESLMCCMADGSEKKVLFDGIIDGLNVIDGMIYFVNKSDKSYPYRMKTDGTNLTRLAETPVDFIVIAGDMIFLLSKSTGAVYMLDSSGYLGRFQ